MATTAWTWADLDGKQLDLVATAERTLGADYLLVFQPADSAASVDPSAGDLQPAQLTASQLECLHGLEQQLNATVVAYKHGT